MVSAATELLTRATRGDEAAADRLMPLVYDELRRLARQYMMRDRGRNAPSLQPTALVHEAYLRLVNQSSVDSQSRTHFYALAAVAMRHVLIDQARGDQRAKRGGHWRRITLTNAFSDVSDDTVDLLGLQEAMGKLAELDERAARVVELRFYSGLTERQVAEVLGVSERTVRNDWSMARAWLRCQLTQDGRTEEP